MSSEHDSRSRTRVWRLRGIATHYVDPILRPLARMLPGFGVVTHRGRKSGRTYATPVNVFRRGDHYLFFLTYGSDAHWVQNILAAGWCDLVARGRLVRLVEPELVTDPELAPAPAFVRFVERRLAGVTQYLRMTASVSGAAHTRRSRAVWN